MCVTLLGMSAATSLDLAISALRSGETYLDVDVIALEAMRDGRVRGSKKRKKALRRDVTDSAAFVPADASQEQSDAKPIIDYTKTERIVYCVALQPNVADTYGSIMAPESIRYTAYRFMMASRVIKVAHDTQIKAYPVESYIAPMDMHFQTGMYGDQTVSKGSWVLGIKVIDDSIWAGIVSGHYTGISVGGLSMQGDLP